MFTFGRRKSALLGLDIGSTAVKLVELSLATDAALSEIRVENYRIEPLPPDAMVEKKIVDIQAVGNTIRKVVLGSGTQARRAATALSGSAVITKVISMSAALSEAELEAQLQLESDRYIPYPLEEVNLDFDILGPSDADGNLVEVLLAASRRENVDDRVAALAAGGLTAVIIDVEAYAMESAFRLLLGEGMGQTSAIVDIGAATTTLHVLHAGRMVYTREQSFGGLQLIAEVRRRYGMGHDEALRQVIAGGLPDGYSDEVLAPFKEALAQQIDRALQFFYSAGTFGHVDRILLAGGVAGICGIDQLMEERLGTITAIADPFASMSWSSGIDPSALKRDAPAMMIAVGLALRGFD